MQEFFHTFFYQPLFNALVGLYSVIPGQDLGVAILVLTIIIRVLLWPISKSAILAQKNMQKLQPKLAELKKKYSDDKQAQSQAMMELYKEEKVNPLGSCLPLLIQLPIFLALYWVLAAGVASENLDILYSFIPNPGSINPIAFGFLDLSKKNLIIALMAGAAQYWQASQLVVKQPEVSGEGSKDESMAAQMNKQMKYMMPIVTIVIGASLPAGLAFYWFLTTLIYAIQQWVMFRKDGVKEVATESGGEIH